MMEPEIGVVCPQAKDGENLGRGEEGFPPESWERAQPCHTAIQTPAQSWETIRLFRATQSMGFVLPWQLHKMNTSAIGHIFYLFILPDPPVFCPFGLCAALVARTEWVCVSCSPEQTQAWGQTQGWLVLATNRKHDS